MKPVIEQKSQLVDAIADKLKNSLTTVVVEYRGLTVKQLTDLRAQLREAGVEYKVYKNNLVERAMEQAGVQGFEGSFIGPNAFATCATDAMAPAKILNNFAKENDKLVIKSGIVDGVVVTAEEIKALAELPSREGLLSMLLSVLQAPIRNLALATKAVAEQKEAQA